VLPDSDALDAACAPDALIAVDAACRVVGLNDVCAAMFGVDRSVAVGCDVRDVLGLREPDGSSLTGWHPSARLQAVRGTPQVELAGAHARGRVLQLVATVRYVRAGRALAGATLALRDPGARRMVTGAAQAVATVAHEVRAPLTSVRGFTSLLLQHGDAFDAAARDDLLQQIASDAERMSRLVGELLDVSRLEAGRLALHRGVVDVVEVCGESAVAAAAGLAGAETSGPVPAVLGPATATAWCDTDKLRQIVVNLVENALKYGVPPVEVVVGVVGDDVTVEVRDRGTVAPEDVPRMFSRYWHRSLPGRPSGTGLGLSIARGLAHAQSGSLDVRSDPSGGTVFTLRLPAA
jgi:signal transduction histidine kinase